MQIVKWALQLLTLEAMDNKTRTDGIVEAVNPATIRVRILDKQECKDCKAAAACHSSNGKGKVVEVPVEAILSSSYKVGDRVVVGTTTSVGLRAVALGFGLPLALLLLSVGIVWATLHDDAAAALAGLIVLVPYYLILYVLRGKLLKAFKLDIE